MLKVKSKYLGIIYIIISALFFAFMNLFIRLSGDVPVMQKCFFRNVVAMVFSFVLLMRNREAFRTGKGHFGDLLIRAVSGTLGIFCNFYAISYIGLTDASILNKLSPFFAIILSIFVLKEKPTAIEWIAVALAFIGAIFVVKPTPSIASIPAVAGVLGGLGAGIAYTFVRKMGKAGVNGNLIIFFFSTFSCLVTLPVLIFDYYEMQWWQFGYLMLAGLSATGGQIFITQAYSHAPAKQISVYDYSIVLFAAVLGFFFLGELPDWLSVIGYVIIITAAVGNWFFALQKDKREREKLTEIQPTGEGTPSKAIEQPTAVAELAKGAESTESKEKLESVEHTEKTGFTDGKPSSFEE